jgi:hypothetical protein
MQSVGRKNPTELQEHRELQRGLQQRGRFHFYEVVRSVLIRYIGELMASYHCECSCANTQWDHLVSSYPATENQEDTERT